MYYTRERKSIRSPRTAVPVLKLYYQRTKIHQVAENGRSSILKLYYQRTKNPSGRRERRFQYSSCTTRERKSIRSPRTAVPVLKLYYQRTKIHQVAENGRSSTQVVLPENKNPSGRRERPFQYSSCTTRERKSIRSPRTAVPVLKLYYQRTKIHQVAENGRSSTQVELSVNENPSGRRERPFQYSSCTTRERKSIRSPRTAAPVLVNLYYQRTKIHQVAENGRSRTKVVLPENVNPSGRRERPLQYSSCTTRERKIHQVAENGRSTTKVVLPENENPSGRRERPFQYSSCTTSERKSDRSPRTAVPVLKLYYQRTKIHQVAENGRSSTQVVLPENENPSGRRERPLQYSSSCTTRERKSIRSPRTAVPLLKLYYQRM